MKTAVHISADYPDPYAGDKTAAVANLISGAPSFHHIVYSLNRVNGVSGVSGFRFNGDDMCLVYRNPPKGLMLRSGLHQLADWIIADLHARDIEPHVVHAHKFTIEGLIALRLKEEFGCPVICNIQGDTDATVAGVRYDLRRAYRRLARESARILSFAPWCGSAIERALGLDLRYEVLPVATNCDGLLAPTLSRRPRLVSLFHLDSWRRKGADRLAAAVALVARDHPGIVLDIYGQGSQSHTKALQAAIRHSAATSLVRLRGPLSREDLQPTLNSYSAFAMPSRRETYGLAFVEALFSGTPVVFPRDRAIDGILPESDMGAGCEPSSVGDIAQAINFVLDNEKSLKGRLRAAQSAGSLDHLRLANITARYRTILEATAA